MFAASKCPSCGKVHGLELPSKTTICRFCGKRYDPNKGSILGSFRDDVSLRSYLQFRSSPLENATGPTMGVPENDTKDSPVKSGKHSKRWIAEKVLEVIEGEGAEMDTIIESLGHLDIPRESVEACVHDLNLSGSIYLNRKGAYIKVQIRP